MSQLCARFISNQNKLSDNTIYESWILAENDFQQQIVIMRKKNSLEI